MRTTALASHLFLLVAALLGGCTRPKDWHPQQSPDEVEAGKILVVVPRTDTGPLHHLYPGGRTDMSLEVAQDLLFLCDHVEAQLGGGEVPPAESNLWAKGEVPAAKGAQLIVLISVTDLAYERRVGSSGNPQRIYASVNMKAMRTDGEVLWERKARGMAPNVRRPKQMSAASKPEAMAAYAALRSLNDDLRSFLGRVTEIELRAKPVAPEFKPKPNIPITIDSTPRGASIYVDGLFRGTTPAEVPLPTRHLTLRIELQGYHVWETPLLPQEGMPIKPTLIPLPGTERPAPKPKPNELPPVEDEKPAPEAEEPAADAKEAAKPS